MKCIRCGKEISQEEFDDNEGLCEICDFDQRLVAEAVAYGYGYE